MLTEVRLTAYGYSLVQAERDSFRHSGRNKYFLRKFRMWMDDPSGDAAFGLPPHERR